jgi:tetratricopeptide (TPR) repeat protein
VFEHEGTSILGLRVWTFFISPASPRAPPGMFGRVRVGANAISGAHAMNVEELKEQARRHEQKEEWQKAFDLYSTALRNHDEDEPPDITLYNRVGDIQTRLGQVNGAVEQYETAISLYLEAELPNNAIAICKKVLRNLPERNIFFLRMGQIRAGQGFLTDARQNFLTYAERQTALGDIESALNALVEFVEISPEDVEIRQSLASQLEAHGRVDEAVEQYQEVYRRMALAGKDEESGAVAERLSELSPDLTLPDLETLRSEEEREEPGELVLESTSLGGLELEDWGEEEGSFEGVEVELDEESAEGSGVEAPESQLTEEAPETPGGGGEFDLSGFELGELEPVELDADEEDEEGEGIEAVEVSDEGGTALEPDWGEEVREEVDEDEDSLPSFDFEAPEEAEDVEIVTGFGFRDEELGEAESGETDEEADLPFIGFEEEEEEEGEVVPSGTGAETGRTDREDLPPERTAGDVSEVDLGDDLPFLDLDEEEEEGPAVEPLPEVPPEESGLAPPPGRTCPGAAEPRGEDGRGRGGSDLRGAGCGTVSGCGGGGGPSHGRRRGGRRLNPGGTRRGGGRSGARPACGAPSGGGGPGRPQGGRRPGRHGPRHGPGSGSPGG